MCITRSPKFIGLCDISFNPLFTVWVTSENQLAKLALRGSSVYRRIFGPKMGVSFMRADPAQFLCLDNCYEAIHAGQPVHFG